MQYIVYSIQYIVCSIYSMQCIVYSIQYIVCSIYSMQCIVYSIQYIVCSIYSMQCIVYSIWYAANSTPQDQLSVIKMSAYVLKDYCGTSSTKCVWIIIHR